MVNKAKSLDRNVDIKRKIKKLIMFLLHQFLLLFIFLLLISSHIKKNSLILVFSFVSSLLIAIETLSIIITGQLFGADFLNYINFQYGLYSIKNIFIFLLISIMLTPFFYFLSNKKILLEKKYFALLIIFLIFIILNIKPYVFYKITHIWVDASNSETLGTSTHLKEIDLNTYAKDTSRFIAHAGGEIDGYKYTDSLEALDNSYQNGFKMFELDILKTKDNVYIAAHDWETWAIKTNYKGTLPPDSQDFLKYKIYNKYSPLDITKINEWFKNHPDAILVTDKINTPLDFSDKFLDKDRLIMELFSWKAVQEGLQANIKSAMPTFGILKEIKGDKINFLIKHKIKNIASSRKKTVKYKKFLLNLKNIGINTYAFNINDYKNIDECYLVSKERDYFYGLYADKWNFNTKTCY